MFSPYCYSMLIGIFMLDEPTVNTGVPELENNELESNK